MKQSWCTLSFMYWGENVTVYLFVQNDVNHGHKRPVKINFVLFFSSISPYLFSSLPSSSENAS